jgi:Cof subfamily protein (haloacid dehalogenase superfamily)
MHCIYNRGRWYSRVRARERDAYVRMLELVCIDVDGTLIGSSGTVAEEVWEAAGRARAAGMRLALCSGRPAFGVTRELAARLDPGGWHVFQNGASVVALAGGESRSAPLPTGIVEELVARSRATGRVLELYTDGDYATERDVPRTREHAALLGVPFAPRPLDALPPGRIVRAQWLLPEDEVAGVLREPHGDLTLAPSTAPAMPDTVFVNMTARGVDKGSAVRAVARALGVALGRVMFVGDGGNDVPALRVVGFPVAMGNAEPAARAAARHHVGHVDAGGLLEALALALRL